MNDKTKESKFLDAINKYAEHQKAQIAQEIEDYKNQKIEQATEQGLQDAYDLIRDDIAKRKATIVNKLSREELKLRNDLFNERKTIYNEVFDAAVEKLKAFTQTPDYTAFLQRSVDEIAVHLNGDACTIYLAPFDADKAHFITEKLKNAEIKTDDHITIGGIKAFCPAKHIMLDDTLDTRLNDQREWFIENSGLKAV